MVEIITFATLIVIGYTFGSRNEKRHYADIIRREKKLLSLPVRSDRQITEEVKEGFLVYGSVVISADYFKAVVAGLRNFFGGRVTAYESLLDRARREATLRMKEMAIKHHADEIINFRLETSMLNDKANNTVVSVEIMAYGTALKR